MQKVMYLGTDKEPESIVFQQKRFPKDVVCIVRSPQLAAKLSNLPYFEMVADDVDSQNPESAPAEVEVDENAVEAEAEDAEIADAEVADAEVAEADG